MENETENQEQTDNSVEIQFEGYNLEFDEKVKLIPVPLEDKL